MSCFSFLNPISPIEGVYLYIQDMNKSHARKSLMASFDPRQYERPGVNTAEVMEMKGIFDLFDLDATGLATIQCTQMTPQK